ncbi:MAG: hypothetical protein JWL73_1307 [Actinomycetia bacterium]|nr:hypothetical protein [Actinomycetes bacterium]
MPDRLISNVRAATEAQAVRCGLASAYAGRGTAVFTCAPL